MGGSSSLVGGSYSESLPREDLFATRLMQIGDFRTFSDAATTIEPRSEVGLLYPMKMTKSAIFVVNFEPILQ